jgi:DNA-binding CsgD family transcriptional regulator
VREWPLVGRQRELDQIARARAARAPGVVVLAEAGVGKSRLARTALARAEMERAATVWVQATRSAASVPLGAFAGVIPIEVRSDDQFELLRQGAAAVRDRGRGRPVVLCVDDAQSLDPVSAALVLEVAGAADAFVLATVRTGEPCPDAIVSLWKDRGADRLELARLDQTDTDQLTESIVGGPVEEKVRHWVWETSRGNALYARELVLGALGGGALEQVRGLWQMSAQPPISASLAEVISARLAGVSSGERRPLELLALGEPLRIAEMIGQVGSEALEAAEARGLITVRPSRDGGEVRLSHPLYGEAIRAGLGTLRGRELRMTLAAIVQARGEPSADDSLRVARWLLDAGEPVPTALLVDAARAANLSGDPDLGATLAASAVDAGGGIEAALVLARAHTVRNRFEAAAAVLATAESEVDSRDAALAYLEQQAAVLCWGLNRPAALQELLDRATRWWPDDAWQHDLDPLRVRFAPLTQSESPSIPLSETSRRPARADLDPRSRRHLELAHIRSLFYSGRGREAYELARRRQPPALRDEADEGAAALLIGIAVETGDGWPELEWWTTVALRDAVKAGDHGAAGIAALGLGHLRFLEGRFLDARRLLTEAELHQEQHDPIGLLAVTTSVQVGIAWSIRDPDGAVGALDRCLAAIRGGEQPIPAQAPYLVCANAWAAMARGDPFRAQRILLEGADSLPVMPLHAARLSYEAMRAGATAGRIAPALRGLEARCDSRLVSAETAHVSARADRDGVALVDASNELEQIGALLYASEAAAHAAETFLQAGRHDSARRAAVRCRELFADGQGATKPQIEGLEGPAVELTAREVQLVELARRGFTNPQIAERLVLSVRTVETHLYRAMRKLGVSDRRDL